MTDETAVKPVTTVQDCVSTFVCVTPLGIFSETVHHVTESCFFIRLCFQLLKKMKDHILENGLTFFFFFLN